MGFKFVFTILQLCYENNYEIMTYVLLQSKYLHEVDSLRC